MGYVVLKVYQDVFSAQMDKAALEGNGIAARLLGDNVGSISPIHALLSGIRLLVPEEDAPAAAAILDGGADFDPPPA